MAIDLAEHGPGNNEKSGDEEVDEMLAAWCGYGWAPGPWFLVFPLLWLAVIVGAFVVFGRRGWMHRHAGSAEEMLAERYARGEITEEEYRQRVAVLRSGR
jgi:putative membrane protein